MNDVGNDAARTVLVTGPAHDLQGWVSAAESAGWRGLPRPLIKIHPTDVDLVALIDGLPDWICVTSSNALDSLERASRRMPELLTASFSCVGSRTQERARALGFKPALPASPDANTLALSLIDTLSPASRVLWPRGSLSSWLGDELKRAGHSLLAPVVYETRPLTGAATLDGVESARAILLASPSAVRAYADRVRAGGSATPLTLAIGQTTALALDEHASMFENVRVLEHPTTTAFAALLRALESTDDDS
ncbi:MAG: uroporphyrinogen-III synthase [Chlamydiales bacterium]|jgi:uroporphyrinogen-III synthase